MLSVCPDEESSITDRYTIIRKELHRFDPELSKRPELVCLTKCDLIDTETRKKYKQDFRNAFPGVKIYSISSIERKGLEKIKYALWEIIQKYIVEDES